MQIWIIQTLNSLALGGLLFMLSSGFALIFGLMRIANLTHGSLFMLGTYVAAITDPDAWSAIRLTLIAAVIAVPLGIMMGAFKPVEAFFEPFISFARYLPASAFIPLLILFIAAGRQLISGIMSGAVKG